MSKDEEMEILIDESDCVDFKASILKEIDQKKKKPPQEPEPKKEDKQK